ncbi:BACON domain-containing protein [Prevotella sp. P6B4]|uniref:BACON domain-containing protein n=1 Tax=Prevotella sp. P6B4 TaxID=1410614 RepID=UPI00048D0759|nr:BACON domain-containing carbohydrate-binding protein [Prevotella sp. P6B4]
MPEGNIKSEVEIPKGAVDYFKNTMNFGFEASEIEMSFSANLKWSMNIASTQNGTRWLTISPTEGSSGSKKVKFTVTDNPTYEDRSVIVQFVCGDTIRNIRVTQKRLEAITLTTDVFKVANDGAIINVEVNHSKDYTYTIPENYKDWIHPRENGTRGLLDQSILSFSIDPSEEYDKREGKIYFHAGNEEEVVTIYQAGEGKLVLSENELNLTGAEQDFTVDISSNFDFSIQMPDVEWLKEDISATRGMSSHQLKFKVTQNDDYNERTAKIKFFDNNSTVYDEVVIKQNSLGPIITLNTSEYTVDSQKQDLDIEVKSNFDYNIDFQGASWVKQRSNKSRGVTSRLLSLSIDENKTYDARTANIKLYDKKSNASEIVTITQEAKKGIEIPTKEFKINELGGTITLTVNANTDYQLTIPDEYKDWIQEVATTRGLASHEHQLTIAPLGEGTDREGSVTISNDKLDYSASVTIKQNNTFYFETNNIEVLIDKEKKVTVKNLTKQDIQWSTDKPAIATVNNGTVKGISKGNATITVKTADGKHIAKCKVKVCEITDMVSAKGRGTATFDGNLVKADSKLKWIFTNNSPVTVKLKSLQLSGSADGETANELYINQDVTAGASYTETTKILDPGLHLPVKCVFTFVYNNTEYTTEAIYEKPNI